MFSNNNDSIFYEYTSLGEENKRFAYKKLGTGSKKMLLFHGYGQDCSCWGKISEKLKEEYTFFSFDLPFHGETNNDFSENSTKNPSKIQLKRILEVFFVENNVNDFSVLGFSLGARMALFCAEIFPENIQKIILLAPDGIKNNFWFDLATRFWFSKMLFKSFLASQGIFIRFGEILSKIGLLDKSILNFVVNQTNSTEKRQKIYNTWQFFAKISPISVKQVLEKKELKKQFLTVFLAQNDAFITGGNIKEKLQNIDYQLSTIDCNHFKLPLLLDKILLKAEL